ncbi:MAG: TIGR03960 family B12-binding radical SAM protein [bacterium]|nr:TIGR03960 family B12-binding radical SAM protein [bacterium]
MSQVNNITESELKSVSKPAQYLGGEVGAIVKNKADIDIRFCLAFPDTYEVGMSHLGMQILYHVINQDPKAWAERAFVPLHDMEALLRSKEASICSLESQTPLKEFDILGFSLQYELSATGILTILDLAKVPFRSADRDESFPLIIGGGPVSYHPEPMADFFDAFLIGDGEELVPEFMVALREAKNEGLSKQKTLEKVAKIKGVYVPSFFSANYDLAGNFTGVTPKFDWYTMVERRALPSLENAPYPTKPIVPSIKAVHDRLSIEVMRGCVRGCRFCQAGYLYRPQRERKPEQILKIIEDTLPNTGYEELSLLSLSTADYCSILPLLSAIKEKYCVDDELAVSFPSTRVDALKPELLAEVQTIRRSGFTIAPEAGTQRLRDVINKGVTDEEIITTCTNVFQMGWDHIKMYFMIGLPTETDDDILGIIDIAKRVKAITKKKQSLIVSVSTHVPKPHTPFQWAEQITDGETLRKQKILYNGLKKIGVQFRYHQAFSTFLEGVFSRGDRKLSHLLELAFKNGCRLDGWVEEIKRDVWEKAFEEVGVDPLHYLHARKEDAALPWDHISCEISKKYFLKEWQRATAARTTPDCLTESCSICGACDYDSKRNVLFDRQRTETRLNIINPPWQAVIDAREQKENLPISIENTKSDSELGALEDLPPQDISGPEFGSGSLDFVPKDELAIDYPFQSPEKPVAIHENVEHQSTTETSAFTPQNPLNRAEKPIVQRVRIRYSKTGKFRFIGHLELASLIFRITRRAQIPLAFSRGFSPKPRMVFGPALQLGIASTWEYVDFFLTKKVSAETIVSSCNQHLPEGISFIEAKDVAIKAKSLQESIEVQSYTLRPVVVEKLPIKDLSPFKDFHLWKTKSVDKDGKGRMIRLEDALTSVSVNGQEAQFEAITKQNIAALRPSEVVASLTGMDPFDFDIEKVAVGMVE